MEYGVCLLPVVPLRTNPSEKEEQCSQLIFGDIFLILEKNKERALVETVYDGYRGWADKKQIVRIDNEDFYFLTKAKPLYTAERLNSVRITNNKTNQTYTAALPFASCLFSSKYQIGNYTIEAPEVALIKQTNFNQDSLKEYVEKYLYTSYLWGGKSNFGIDCSGFTQSVFKLFGCKLKRDAALQAEQGVEVRSLSEAKAGDLAFFRNSEGKIIHVGILLSNNQIAHSSGYVRIDAIDSKGIISPEDQSYTHTLKQIRRYF